MILLEDVECICHEKKKKLLFWLPSLGFPQHPSWGAALGLERVAPACSASVLRGIRPGCTVGMVCLSFLWFYSAALHQEPFHVKPISKSEAPSEFHAVLQHDKEEIILFFFLEREYLK